MPKPAYRKASRQTGLWIILCIIGSVGQVSMAPVINFFFGRNPSDWAFLIFLAPLTIMIIAAFTVSKYLQRGRRKKIAARLPALSFHCDLAPSKDDQAALLATIQHVRAALNLIDDRASVQWIAHRNTDKGRILLFEYEFHTGSGKSTQLHVRTVLAVPSSIAGFGEGLGFTGVRFLWHERRREREREWKDARFADLAKEWSLFNDAETGAQFLKPAVQAELAHSPKGEWWMIGGGWACCVFRDYLNADNMAVFIERTLSIIELSTKSAS
jgi:hypothetical protein